MSLGQKKTVYNAAIAEGKGIMMDNINEAPVNATLFDNIISSIRQERENIECRIDFLSENNNRLRRLIANVVGEFPMDPDASGNKAERKEPHTKADKLSYELELLHTRIDSVHRLNQEYNSLLNSLETIL